MDVHNAAQPEPFDGDQGVDPMIKRGSDDLPVLEYARAREPGWTRFEKAIAVAAGLDFLMLAPVTADLLHHVPGQLDSFLPEGDWGLLGLFAAGGAVVLWVLALISQNTTLMCCTGSLILIGLVFVGRIIWLLHYL